jgi:hypothetical protein
MAESFTPLHDVVNRNVKAEIARAGKKNAHAFAPLDVTRRYAEARFRGEQPWKLDELDALAGWLQVSTNQLTTRPQ